MVFRLLTDRQGVYLRHACDGKTDREIAAAFGTSVANIGGVRSKILLRIRAASIDEVCRMVAENHSPPALFQGFKARPK
jgi:DNA-binding CsgD family transcriptional regulator